MNWIGQSRVQSLHIKASSLSNASRAWSSETLVTNPHLLKKLVVTGLRVQHPVGTGKLIKMLSIFNNLTTLQLHFGIRFDLLTNVQHRLREFSYTLLKSLTQMPKLKNIQLQLPFAASSEAEGEGKFEPEEPFNIQEADFPFKLNSFRLITRQHQMNDFELGSWKKVLEGQGSLTSLELRVWNTPRDFSTAALLKSQHSLRRLSLVQSVRQDEVIFFRWPDLSDMNLEYFKHWNTNYDLGMNSPVQTLKSLALLQVLDLSHVGLSEESMGRLLLETPHLKEATFRHWSTWTQSSSTEFCILFQIKLAAVIAILLPRRVMKKLFLLDLCLQSQSSLFPLSSTLKAVVAASLSYSVAHDQYSYEICNDSSLEVH
jgi:hypothetical protein